MSVINMKKSIIYAKVFIFISTIVYYNVAYDFFHNTSLILKLIMI